MGNIDEGFYENVRVFELPLPAGCRDVPLWWWLPKKESPAISTCVDRTEFCACVCSVIFV